MRVRERRGQNDAEVPSSKSILQKIKGKLRKVAYLWEGRRNRVPFCV